MTDEQKQPAPADDTTLHVWQRPELHTFAARVAENGPTPAHDGISGNAS